MDMFHKGVALKMVQDNCKNSDTMLKIYTICDMDKELPTNVKCPSNM